MHQEFTAENKVDSGGLPAGGSVEGLGLDVVWQAGPLRVGGTWISPNGAFVETLIDAVIQRIRWYQTVEGGRFSCRQNALAITKLEEANHWLDDRTKERQERGVEGTHEP